MRGLGRWMQLESRVTPSTLIFTNEHAELNFSFNPGQWSMSIRDEEIDPPVDYPSDPVPPVGPPAAILYAHPNAMTTQTSDPAMAFLGVADGQAYWRLPQMQNINLLYLGVSGYGSSGLNPYSPAIESKSRVNASGRWMRVQLVEVDGPGHFSVWQDTIHGPLVWMSSYNDGVANPGANGIDTTDGIGPDDSLWITQNGHLHHNWAFTARGRYRVTFQAHGFWDDDGNTATPGVPVSSAPRSFVFSVDSVGQLRFAEPDYLAVASAGLATITVTRTGGSDGSIQVNYATGQGGTATAGVDFMPVSGTLTFHDGETSKTFTVPIPPGAASNGAVTVPLVLSEFRPLNKPAGLAGNPPMAGHPVSAVLTIRDQSGPADPPPEVEQVVINPGSPQRSRVTQIHVTFSEIVTLGAAAFAVRRLSDDLSAGVQVSAAVVNDRTVATLTFVGTGVEAGSLADGRWRLTVSASAVTDSGGQVMTADSHTPFHRLFGDADGNATVNFADFLLFRPAFGSAGSPTFDADANGTIDFQDFLQFRTRFGTALP